MLGDHGPARRELREPVAVALLSDGSIAALERDRGSLVLFDGRGRYLRTLGGAGGVRGLELRRPEGLGVDSEENLWVADTGNHRLLVVEPDGTRVATYGSLGSSGERLREPRGITFDRAGLAYVADTGNKRIQVLRASSGAVVSSWGSRTGGRRGRLTQPVALAYSGRDSGGIWVLNRDAGRRLEFFDLDGSWQTGLDVPETVEDEVELVGVAVDPGLYRMFLADRAGGRVLVLDRRGVLKRVVAAEDGALQPRGVAVSRSLDLYVADVAGRRVVHFSAR